MPFHAYILAKTPVTKKVLKVVINSFGYEKFTIFEEVRYNKEELLKLLGKHKGGHGNGNGVLNISCCFQNEPPNEELNDCIFIDERLPRNNKLTITINRAKMYHVKDVSTNEDARINLKIKMKSKNLKEALKQCSNLGICVNGKLPEYIKKHFSTCAVNKINHIIE